VLDLEKIEAALFREPGRSRIARDYEIDAQVATSKDFADAIVTKLAQPVIADPLARKNLIPTRVFRAAVWAVGSNSRTWVAFRRQEQLLSQRLGGYDPENLSPREITGEELVRFFPGATGRKDANAVINWLQRLRARDFGEELIGCAQAIENVWTRRFGKKPEPEHLMPPLAVFMSMPQPRSDGFALLTGRSASELKLSGMGPTLASEFLRNLGWSGFKPDRHVQRLFARWLSSSQMARFDEEVSDVALMLGWPGSKDVSEFLRCSLLGQSLTPAGAPFSLVDNLVWLLGAYVERKNHESNQSYLQ